MPSPGTVAHTQRRNAEATFLADCVVLFRIFASIGYFLNERKRARLIHINRTAHKNVVKEKSTAVYFFIALRVYHGVFLFLRLRVLHVFLLLVHRVFLIRYRKVCSVFVRVRKALQQY